MTKQVEDQSLIGLAHASSPTCLWLFDSVKQTSKILRLLKKCNQKTLFPDEKIEFPPGA